MNILFAADIFPPQSGGPATYVVGMAEALAARGHRVKIVSLNPDSDVQCVSGDVFVASSRFKMLRYMQYLWLLLREGRTADILYAMGPVNAGFPTRIAGVILRKPYVVKVVGDYAWEQGVQRCGVSHDVDTFQSSPEGSIGVRMLRAVQRHVTRHAARVIVPSAYLKTMVVGWGVRSDRVSVVYNAVQIPDVIPVEKGTGEWWLIFTGRMVSWKGVVHVVDAVHQAIQLHPQIRFLVIGSGPNFEAIEARVKLHGLGEIVRLYGRLPRAEALAYMSAADACILNSGYEGLSHTLLEAAHMGVHILASDRGGNPELCDMLGTGRLFPLNHTPAIVQAITDAVDTPAPQRTSLPHHFSFDTMIKKTESILASVCQHS